MAVRKRTIESAPTIPRDRTTYIRGYCENNDGCNHSQSNERCAKTCGIHHTTVGFLIDEEDKQTNAKGQHNGQQHIKNSDRRYIFQKTGLENIVESHDYSFIVVRIVS